MGRPATALALSALLLTAVHAQQTGSATSNYAINSVGANQPSFVLTTVGVPVSVLTHTYATLSPGAPLVWAYSGAGQIGSFATPTNSVDLDLSQLQFLLDFNGTGPLSLIAYTNTSGTFTLTHPTSLALVGLQWYLAFAHASAGSPDGFFVSQTHAVSFLADPSLSASGGACSATQVVTLTDDSFQALSLGFGFNYFGTVYSTAFLGSNGYVTFNAGDTVYTENVAGFLSGQPRIAHSWDDLNPGSGGNYTFFTDGIGNFEVCMNGVPEYVNTGSNTLRVNASNGTFISFNYFTLSLTDCLVGLSPGTSQATGMPVNLSVGVPTIPAGSAPYELFTGGTPPSGNPFDLQNLQITWILTPTGVPIAGL